MKVFIWNDEWRQDCTSGCAVVIANDVDEARRLLRVSVSESGAQSRAEDTEREPTSVCELNEPKVIVDMDGGQW